MNNNNNTNQMTAFKFNLFHESTDLETPLIDGWDTARLDKTFPCLSFLEIRSKLDLVWMTGIHYNSFAKWIRPLVHLDRESAETLDTHALELELREVIRLQTKPTKHADLVVSRLYTAIRQVLRLEHQPPVRSVESVLTRFPACVRTYHLVLDTKFDWMHPLLVDLTYATPVPTRKPLGFTHALIPAHEQGPAAAPPGIAEEEEEEEEEEEDSVVKPMFDLSGGGGGGSRKHVLQALISVHGSGPSAKKPETALVPTESVFVYDLSSSSSSGPSAKRHKPAEPAPAETVRVPEPAPAPAPAPAETVRVPEPAPAPESAETVVVPEPAPAPAPAPESAETVVVPEPVVAASLSAADLLSVMIRNYDYVIEMHTLLKEEYLARRRRETTNS